MGSATEIRPGRLAFTLIELVVAIAILAILTGLMLAGVQRVRAAAARSHCANQLRQIGLALHNYHDVHSVLPPGMSYQGGKDPQAFMSWNTRLLPFLEQEASWKNAENAFAQDPDFRHNPPHELLGTAMPVYVCPASSRAISENSHWAFTWYLGVEGVDQFARNGALFLDSRVRFGDIRDGTSQTLMVGERPPSADEIFGWWYAGKGQANDGSGDMLLGAREMNSFTYVANCHGGPYHYQSGQLDNQCDLFHFWSLHPNGANFAFCDGSVRFLSYSADSILPALSTRAGGEAINYSD